MKIYLEKLNTNNLNNIKNINNNLKLLDSYKKTNVKYYDIYSNSGIYILENNNLKKKIISKDEAVKKIINNNIKFLIDNSKIIYDNEIYQIPYNYYILKIEEIKFDINNNLKLIIKYVENKLNELYFIVKNIESNNDETNKLFQEISNILIILNIKDIQ